MSDPVDRSAPLDRCWLASSAPLDRCWLALLAGLAVSTALLYAFPLSHLASPLSFNYSEGWNGYWAQAAAAGRPLYAAPPDLTLANYPPLSFHLVGRLGRAFGDVTLAGRVVGLLCLACSALAVAAIAAAIAGNRRAGAYAALCLLLWVALLTPARIATNDPHFLGLALATSGLFAYVRAGGRPPGIAAWIAAAAVAFAAALFVKNNLLAFPLATALHLAALRRVRPLLLFAAAGALAAGLLLALTLAVDGRFFFAHLLAPRAWSRADGIASASAFYAYLVAPVLVGVAGLLWRPRPRAGYVALCLACAAFLAGTFAFGNGVANNIYYETLAALAIAAALALDAVSRGLGTLRRGWVPVLAVSLLPVGAVLVHAPVELYGALGRATRLPQRTADWTAGVALLAATPGPALCESLLMCLEAGKPFAVDPYYVHDQIRIGRIPASRLLDALNARAYAAIQIGEDDPAFTLAPGDRLRFGADAMAALLANYRVAHQAQTFAILLPR